MQRFRQVLAYIEAHPEEWDQRHCETCFIGLAGKHFGGGFRSPRFSLAGEEFLELQHGSGEFEWIFWPARTLDDFRTVARRPYA